jgi:AcrR family transcriptional regulator
VAVEAFLGHNRTIVLTKGERTRQAILDTAAGIASEHGLESLSIGGLAAATGMSKSGLFAHFGSKEELQLATIDAARRRFVDHVIRPSRGLPRGRARLEAMLDDLLGYYRAETFPGGCFFHNVKAEFDSRPDTAVRAVMAEEVRQFMAFLEREVRKTQDAGELDPSLDPAQIAFELDALGSAANAHFQILRDPAVFDRAALGMRRSLNLVHAQ